MGDQVTLLKKNQRLRLDLILSLCIFVGSLYLLFETLDFPAIARWFPLGTLYAIATCAFMRLVVFIARIFGHAGGPAKELGSVAKYDFQASTAGLDRAGFSWLGIYSLLGILSWLLGVPLAVAVWSGILLHRVGEVAWNRAALAGGAFGLFIYILNVVGLLRLPDSLLSRVLS